MAGGPLFRSTLIELLATLIVALILVVLCFVMDASKDTGVV